MNNKNVFLREGETAWCPGCGNFGIRSAIVKALAALDLRSRDVLLVSGIGQAAKLPHYVEANCFNGLHGRALPVATGAKIANRGLTVLVTTGDGDCYGEGGNHFIHAVRRNLDITLIVHDNQIYGLTKGQASPTTDEGYVTKIQYSGTLLEPLHPLELAIALGCGFVARGFSGNSEHLADLIQAGVKYSGFALIDVLQPCVSFNKKNTFSWYKQRVYDCADDSSFDPSDKAAAYRKAAEWEDRIPTGIIYRTEKTNYEQKTGITDYTTLCRRQIDASDISVLLSDFM